MGKVQKINVKDTTIRTMKAGAADYICITDIARLKNTVMRNRNTIEYHGMWKMLNNPNFKGVEFAPLFMANPSK